MTKRTGDMSFMLQNKFRIKGMDEGCTVCGSPVHPATGVCGPGAMCGPCLMSMRQGFMEIAHPNRKCSGIAFYAHARSPQS